MKNFFLKYTLLVIGFIIFIIVYLSTVGLETEKFNKQIKDKVAHINSNLDLKLKKMKLTLDPFNLKVNIKTIGATIIYQKNNIKIEYIKTQIPLISLIKNKFVSSNLEISTRSLLLKDLLTFLRATSNKPELFLLERLVKKGHIIAYIKLNFDKNGNIKKNDYEASLLIKDASINFLKNYSFKKINFLLEISDNIFNFKDINFTTNKVNFFSNNLKVTQNENDLIFEGIIENKDSTLDNKIINLEKLNITNVNFSSKNNFSFRINNKFKLKNLEIDSEIDIDELEYKTPDYIKENLGEVKNIIYLKNHKIKTKYKKDVYSIKGSGKIKLQNQFDEIEYIINSKNKDFNLILKIALSELSLKKQEFLKIFFPKINNKIILKKHQVEINYDKNNLLFKGSGNIKLEKKFDKIDYSISKSDNKFNFDTKLYLDETLLKIDYLNFRKNKGLNTQFTVIGNYEKNTGLNLKKLSITDNDTKIILNNLLLDNKNKIIKIDKLDLNYIDVENKKNQLLLLKHKKDSYEMKGSIFNANSFISNLLKNKKNDQKNKIFNNNINLSINLAEVYMDEKVTVKNLKGKINFKDNKVYQANVSGLFDSNEHLTFTIVTNKSEKITTLFSSRAKPLVKRYNFIKGYEGGYLDFYSSKKDDVSKSILKIYDFKLNELPTLTKLLTLASLQGIADILSGEGIRFDEFEMNFNNKGNLTTIDELYAIGPSISILMNGYVENDKLVSLRGTLVPATTINKIISNIPFLGKILVGDKTGEGVFGVSFKIKGSPKNLVTTVNPIKTLTPRFITRTLEKIKKN